MLCLLILGQLHSYSYLAKISFTAFENPFKIDNPFLLFYDETLFSMCISKKSHDPNSHAPMLQKAPCSKSFMLTKSDACNISRSQCLKLSGYQSAQSFKSQITMVPKSSDLRGLSYQIPVLSMSQNAQKVSKSHCFKDLMILKSYEPNEEKSCSQIGYPFFHLAIYSFFYMTQG